MSNKNINTFVIPIIREEFIVDMLESLYKYTDMSRHSVIVIDQTERGMYGVIRDMVDLYIRPSRNLGFAKATNTGIRASTTKYITCANDDILFIDKRWWDAIEKELENHPDIGGVNPFSVWAAGWGYGAKTEEEIKEKLKLFGERGNVVNKKPLIYSYLPEGDITADDYEYLLKNSRGYIDGIATWCTTFRRDALKLKGLFDERFYPGGGEDYDIGGRFYDKDYPYEGAGRLRLCATASSWVKHLWSQSKGYKGSPKGYGIDGNRMWNKLGECYPENPEKGKKKDHCFNGHPTLSRGRVGKVEVVDL